MDLEEYLNASFRQFLEISQVYGLVKKNDVAPLQELISAWGYMEEGRGGREGGGVREGGGGEGEVGQGGGWEGRSSPCSRERGTREEWTKGRETKEGGKEGRKEGRKEGGKEGGGKEGGRGHRREKGEEKELAGKEKEGDSKRKKEGGEKRAKMPTGTPKRHGSKKLLDPPVSGNSGTSSSESMSHGNSGKIEKRSKPTLSSSSSENAPGSEARKHPKK
jgi:hypothetical protein